MPTLLPHQPCSVSYNTNTRSSGCHKALPQLQHRHATVAAAAPCRPARAVRRVCVEPANIAAGLPPAPQPPSSPSKSKKVSKLGSSSSSASSLPTMLAGLSGGVLIGAAALHLGGDVDHATTLVGAAANTVNTVKEFGPADVIAQSFGPTRPLWSVLIHSHQAAAASAARHAAAGAQVGGVGDGGAAASLFSEARGAAEDAAVAVRGLVGGLCDDYNRWLQESPLLCKIVTGNFFTVAGDMLAQLGLGGGGGSHGGGEAAPAGGKRRLDLMRTGRLCLETSAIGTPMGHWWFNLLDTHILPDDPHCPTAVVTKMLADQVLFAPFGLLLFFVVIKLLEGRPRDLPATLRSSYVTALLGGYLLWPVAGLLNFALLPNEYRLLFNNCVNIIWTCFLSIMSSGGGLPKTAEPTAAAEASHANTGASAASSHAALAAAVESAVVLAAIGGAAASGRPSFAFVTSLTAAAVESALSACAAEASTLAPAPTPVVVEPSSPSSPSYVPSFAAGASVAVGSPCLEVCEQPVDALYEIR